MTRLSIRLASPVLASLGIGLLFGFALLVGCQSAVAQSRTELATDRGDDTTAALADEDGVIVSWHQSWTLQDDGSIRRRDHQKFRLQNQRAIRDFGDPRIDFVAGQDELIVHAARTHLPDGTVLPVPDYSFNAAAPDDVAGWPAYADWQEKVVSFSGIEAGAVLELDYEVVSPPGVHPFLEADLRLCGEYPTLERVVSVTVPEGTTLRHGGGDSAPAVAVTSTQRGEGGSTYVWTFARLPADRDEPQAPSWQVRSGRLRFTTCPDDGQWVQTLLKRVEAAAVASPAIGDWARKVVENEPDPAEQIRKVSKKFADSFNFVNSDKALRGLECRSSDTVRSANYGNKLEAAALLLAMVRSLGHEASLAVGVDWPESSSAVRPAEAADEPRVPTLADLAGVVVVVPVSSGPIYVHPQAGVFKNPGQWGRHRLLTLDEAGTVTSTPVYARGQDAPSELTLSGKLTIDKESKLTGELRIQATGAFFDPDKLDSAETQAKRVGEFVERVLSDVKVSSHSVVTLSDEAFRATAQVAVEEPLAKHGPARVLRLGDGPAFLPDVPMPLARSQRRTNVELAGAFRERVDLTIELAEGLNVATLPAALPEVSGPWGAAGQVVERDGKTIHFRRWIEVRSPSLAPDVFAAVRSAVNDLRATQCLVLALEAGS